MFLFVRKECIILRSTFRGIQFHMDMTRLCTVLMKGNSLSEKNLYSNCDQVYNIIWQLTGLLRTHVPRGVIHLALLLLFYLSNVIYLLL